MARHPANLFLDPPSRCKVPSPATVSSGSSPHIVVTGPLGVGKTSVAELLAAALGIAPRLHDFMKNPYLPLFYEDSRAWSFRSQMFFFAQALADHQTARAFGGIQDYSFYDVHKIFSRSLASQNLLDSTEFGILEAMFNATNGLLSPPDLAVVLLASPAALKDRITRRGRPLEQSVTMDFLEDILTNSMELWNTSAPCHVITFDTTDLDVRGAFGRALLFKEVLDALGISNDEGCSS